MSALSVPLDAELAAFIEGRPSINLAACDARLRPSLARALGARVSEDRRRIRLLLAQDQSHLLLADVRRSGRLAVVFSDVTSHRTVQLKGDDACVLAHTDQDLVTVRRYRQEFACTLGGVGYRADLIRGFLHCADADLVAVEFTPAAAFSSTPGPRAGEPLRGAP